MGSGMSNYRRTLGALALSLALLAPDAIKPAATVNTSVTVHHKAAPPAVAGGMASHP